MERAQAVVARWTKRATDLAGRVVVVNLKCFRAVQSDSADCAVAALLVEQRVQVGREHVVARQACSRKASFPPDPFIPSPLAQGLALRAARSQSIWLRSVGPEIVDWFHDTALPTLLLIGLHNVFGTAALHSGPERLSFGAGTRRAVARQRIGRRPVSIKPITREHLATRRAHARPSAIGNLGPTTRRTCGQSTLDVVLSQDALGAASAPAHPVAPISAWLVTKPQHTQPAIGLANEIYSTALEHMF